MSRENRPFGKTAERSNYMVLELGQMVSISKYRDTTWYRYQTFEVSKYRLDSSIILLYLNVDTYFVIWILYADFQIRPTVRDFIDTMYLEVCIENFSFIGNSI